MIRIFNVFVPASVIALLASEIVLIYSCYIVASFFTLDIDPGIFFFYDNGIWRLTIVVAGLMIGIYLHDLYTQFRIKSRILLVQQLCLIVGIAFLTQALLSYLKLPDWTLPKWQMIYGSGLTLVLLPAWRLLYGAVIFRALGSERLLFLGSSSASREIAAYLADHPESGLSCAGYVDDLDEPGTELPGCKVIGPVANLTSIVNEIKPDRIVVGMAERRERLPMEELLRLRFSGIHIQEVQSTYESTFGRVCIREIRPSQLIFTSELGPNPKQVTFQTAYSLLLALVGAVIFSPVMLLVALAVRVSSPGPILYRQKRVGQSDVPFTLYKFRSMYVDAEARTGAVWAKKDDPRVTPAGRWLRVLRLDELPQIFNVLKGEMSVVGPRPERPEFVTELEKKIPYYSQRHCVKPGITGWAQINYKYGETIEDTMNKLEYDLYYIKNMSPALDFFIIFHTAKTMLLRRGSQ
ncbi:MAG TPA: sugar transferase [Bryobacteraceae bacterium]|nr:sugar transferase [Bryobacteraceae bacterium]